MAEVLKRYYLKEEEFLDEFGNVAAAAASHLNDEWRPNYSCDDSVRRNRGYFLASGELAQLVFDGAAVYHDVGGFCSAQITVRSANRVVTVRVKRFGSDLVAETLVDRSPSDAV